MRPSPVSLAAPLVVTSAGVEALVVAEASEASVVLLADSST